MPRLSDVELREKSIIQLEDYADEHPKEGMRVAGLLGEASVRVAYRTIKRKIPNCCTTTATYTYTTE